MSTSLLPYLNVVHGEYLLLRDLYLEKKCTHTELGAALDRYHAAIAAHVAAEVAAERAKHVVPQIIRDAAEEKADVYDEYRRANIYTSTANLYKQRAEAVHTWLASLPPLTPEPLQPGYNMMIGGSPDTVGL